MLKVLVVVKNLICYGGCCYIFFIITIVNIIINSAGVIGQV